MSGKSFCAPVENWQDLLDKAEQWRDQYNTPSLDLVDENGKYCFTLLAPEVKDKPAAIPVCEKVAKPARTMPSYLRVVK